MSQELNADHVEFKVFTNGAVDIFCSCTKEPEREQSLYEEIEETMW